MTLVPVNHAGPDPIQAQDADCFLLDQGSGELSLIGRFVSFMFSVRSATRPYNTLNQRIPRLLDGTLTFEWTLQRGMVDTRVVERTFGYATEEDGSRARMTRQDRISRHPRFSLVIEFNPPELEGDLEGRNSTGRYVLAYCKTENFSAGADGSNNGIVPVQWEGMAEGIFYEDNTTDFSSATGGEPVAFDPENPVPSIPEALQ
jgi:hypothetical protein